MDQPEDRRWTARRKFWFPSGILVDRRASFERRSGTDRRRSPSTLPPGLSVDRRATLDRRAPAPRRAGERRLGPRRPTDRSPEQPE
jgi:hypothetical protein